MTPTRGSKNSSIDHRPGIKTKSPEKRRLRVMYLVDSLRVGGKERQLIEMLKGLTALDCIDPIVVTMGPEQFYVSEVERLKIPLIYLLRKVRWDPTVVPRLWRILREFRPDIIDTNSEMSMTYVWPLARLLKIKVINFTVQNAFSGKGLRWQWHKTLLRLADACVSNSRAGFATRGVNPDANGKYVICNGLDMKRFQTASSDSPTLGFDIGDRKVVGMVAEFSDYKDFPTFIQAAQAILEKRNDVVFVAIGGGRNLEACKKMASESTDGIKFLGERKDVEALVQQLDIGVLCTFTEGISNSVLEYMAAGKPVVVTDGGGSCELVTNGEEGFLVPPSKPSAVVERILELLNDPIQARKMGALGRQKVDQRFSLERLTQETLRMYREVAGPGASRV